MKANTKVYTSTVIAALGGLLFGCDKAGISGPPPTGFSVEKGKLLLGGQPYRGMGINYVQCFWELLKESKVDLSALWNFCPPGKTFQPDIDLTPANEGSWLLPEIAVFNRAVSGEAFSSQP